MLNYHPLGELLYPQRPSALAGSAGITSPTLHLTSPLRPSCYQNSGGWQGYVVSHVLVTLQTRRVQG